jgi:hypothetical protein
MAEKFAVIREVRIRAGGRGGGMRGAFTGTSDKLEVTAGI